MSWFNEDDRCYNGGEKHYFTGRYTIKNLI